MSHSPESSFTLGASPASSALVGPAEPSSARPSLHQPRSPLMPSSSSSSSASAPAPAPTVASAAPGLSPAQLSSAPRFAPSFGAAAGVKSPGASPRLTSTSLSTNSTSSSAALPPRPPPHAAHSAPHGSGVLATLSALQSPATGPASATSAGTAGSSGAYNASAGSSPVFPPLPPSKPPLHAPAFVGVGSGSPAPVGNPSSSGSNAASAGGYGYGDHGVNSNSGNVGSILLSLSAGPHAAPAPAPVETTNGGATPPTSSPNTHPYSYINPPKPQQQQSYGTTSSNSGVMMSSYSSYNNNNNNNANSSSKLKLSASIKDGADSSPADPSAAASALAQPPGNAALIVTSLLLLFTAIINSIFFKKMTDAMPNYPWFLAQLSTIVYVPVFFGLVFMHRDKITPEMHAFPKFKFFVMGAFDAMSGILSMFGGVHTSCSLQALLSNAIIPFTMVLAYFWAQERFTRYQVLGSTVILVGVAAAMMPSFFPSGAAAAAASEDRSNSPFYVVLFVLNNLPSAVSSVYKEVAFNDVEMDVNFLQAWVALWQLLFGFVMIPLNTLSILGPDRIPFDEMGSSFMNGLWCLLGYDHIKLPKCRMPRPALPQRLRAGRRRRGTPPPPPASAAGHSSSSSAGSGSDASTAAFLEVAASVTQQQLGGHGASILLSSSSTSSVAAGGDYSGQTATSLGNAAGSVDGALLLSSLFLLRGGSATGGPQSLAEVKPPRDAVNPDVSAVASEFSAYPTAEAFEQALLELSADITHSKNPENASFNSARVINVESSVSDTVYVSADGGSNSADDDDITVTDDDDGDDDGSAADADTSPNPGHGKSSPFAAADDAAEPHVNRAALPACDACRGAWLPVFIYLSANMLYNYFMVVIIKNGGASLLYVIMTLRLPLVQLAMAIPAINTPPDTFGAAELSGLSLILLGLGSYKYGEPDPDDAAGDGDESDTETIDDGTGRAIKTKRAGAATALTAAAGPGMGRRGVKVYDADGFLIDEDDYSMRDHFHDHDGTAGAAEAGYGSYGGQWGAAGKQAQKGAASTESTALLGPGRSSSSGPSRAHHGAGASGAGATKKPRFAASMLYSAAGHGNVGVNITTSIQTRAHAEWAGAVRRAKTAVQQREAYLLRVLGLAGASPRVAAVAAASPAFGGGLSSPRVGAMNTPRLGAAASPRVPPSGFAAAALGGSAVTSHGLGASLGGSPFTLAAPSSLSTSSSLSSGGGGGFSSLASAAVSLPAPVPVSSASAAAAATLNMNGGGGASPLSSLSLASQPSPSPPAGALNASGGASGAGTPTCRASTAVASGFAIVNPARSRNNSITGTLFPKLPANATGNATAVVSSSFASSSSSSLSSNSANGSVLMSPVSPITPLSAATGPAQQQSVFANVSDSHLYSQSHGHSAGSGVLGGLGLVASTATPSPRASPSATPSPAHSPSSSSNSGAHFASAGQYGAAGLGLSLVTPPAASTPNVNATLAATGAIPAGVSNVAGGVSGSCSDSAAVSPAACVPPSPLSAHSLSQSSSSLNHGLHYVPSANGTSAGAGSGSTGGLLTGVTPRTPRALLQPTVITTTTATTTTTVTVGSGAPAHTVLVNGSGGLNGLGAKRVLWNSPLATPAAPLNGNSNNLNASAGNSAAMGTLRQAPQQQQQQQQQQPQDPSK